MSTFYYDIAYLSIIFYIKSKWVIFFK